MTGRRESIITYLLLAGCVLFAGHLLFSGIAAFSAQNYLMSDYGVYTNTIYNIAHGNGFKFLVDQSYLKTHLSFSLILLAPLFWVFRTPMLLIFVQWLFLISGCTILFRIMQKREVAWPIRAGILFFVCAYPMTQSVMLSEFHGVSAYYLLIPWLVHEILFRKRLAVIPIACILGLREDAGIVVLPILLYFAFTEKWKGGYILAGASLLYVIVSVTILYPMINGVSLFTVRASEASSHGIAAAWSSDSLLLRAKALGWLLLPVIPAALLCGKRWPALVLFPSAALLAAMLSGHERQHSLTFHYPAPIMSALACAMAIAVLPRIRALKTYMTIGALALVVLVAHSTNGFFLGSGNAHPVYSRLDPKLRCLQELRKSVPREGLLLAHRKIAPHFSTREDIITFFYFDRNIHHPDFIICTSYDLLGNHAVWIRTQVADGTYGLLAQVAPYLLLKRGAPPSPELLTTPSLPATLMLSHGGTTQFTEEHGLVLYWNGLDREAPITLAYGHSIPLDAGLYEAVFFLKVIPEETEKGPGVASIHIKGRTEPLARRELMFPTNPTDFFDLVVPFQLTAESQVEPRITGGGAELWVQSVTFRPTAR